LLQKLKIALTVVTILLLVAILAFVVFYFWATSGTLPEEKLSEIITYSNSPAKTPEDKGDKEIFTVMTYNIGYLSGMLNNRPVRADKTFFEKNMAAFLHVLNDVQPDFIGFQEIDFHSHRSYYIDQLRTIAENAGYPYAAKAINWDKRYVPFPYWPPSVHFGRMLSGQAVLSRYPILSAKRVVLQKAATKPFYYNAFYLDRLVQVVKIKTGSKELIILNVHLEAFSKNTREKQVNVVLDIYRSYKNNYPVLVIGDFNCVPPTAPKKNNFSDEPETDFTGDQTIRFFLDEPGLEISSPERFTFPADKPNRKLDYIFYSRDKIDLIEAFIPESAGSDHLPLVIRFSFPS